MQNLNPTRIIARRGRNFMLSGAGLLIGGLVFSALVLLLIILTSTTFFGILFLALGGVGVLAGIGLVIRGLTFRRDNPEARIVGDALGHELDARYYYIRNIGKRGLGYIDAVLVGPPGALVFRITNEVGSFVNEDADWLEESGGRGLTLKQHDFTRECAVDVHALRDYLAARGLQHVPVYGIVVFVNPRTQIRTNQPRIPVAELNTLKMVMQGDFLALDRIAPEEVKQIVDEIYN